MWEIPRTTFPVPWQIPWATGRFYSHTLGTTIVASPFSATNLFVAPIYVPNQIAVNSIGIDVTTGVTGSRIRCALYEYIEEGLLGRLVLDSGTFFTTVTGYTSTPISKTLSQGWYQMAAYGQGTSSYNFYSDGELNPIRGWEVPLDTTTDNWTTRMVIAAADGLNILANGFPNYLSNNPVGAMQEIASANALRLFLGT